MSLKDDLYALGYTSEDVANTLRTKGCKGYPKSCHSCPIAEYLKSLGYKGVMVDIPYIEANSPYDFEDTDHLASGAVEDFINDFDAGKYPDLVKES